MIAGLKLPGIGDLSLGSRLTDWGYAAGWLTVRAMPEFAARNVFVGGNNLPSLASLPIAEARRVFGELHVTGWRGEVKALGGAPPEGC